MVTHMGSTSEKIPKRSRRAKGPVFGSECVVYDWNEVQWLEGRDIEASACEAMWSASRGFAAFSRISHHPTFHFAGAFSTREHPPTPQRRNGENCAKEKQGS
jgi:hypothetical protein